ncbi:MAG TPA: hypothetical protein VGO74_12745 [Modestobacter sp.]|nr:hypothetical protein [Modestobacter sp.]
MSGAGWTELTPREHEVLVAVRAAPGTGPPPALGTACPWTRDALTGRARLVGAGH